MKQILVAGLAFSLISTVSFAQDNNGYVDDRYYSGSQAEQDAKAQSKVEQKQQRPNRQNEDAEYYTSSGNNGYDYNGEAQSYNTATSEYDDSYIDYDDDSYTTRMRRFYYPMTGAGYWGSVYSPYWYDPFWSDPFYGWGGWYRPGFSMGFGFGPYWNSCWGLSAWYGFGGFNYWGYPAYGYGWGGGFYGWGGGYGGYWNGYYAGLYDGNRYNSYRRGVNYGPRGNVGIRTVGNYGPGRIAGRGVNGMVTPINGRINNNSGSLSRGNAVRLNDNNRNVRPESNLGERPNAGNAVRANDPRANNRINLNQGNQRAFEVERSSRAMDRQGTVQQERSSGRGGFFNGIFNNGGNSQRSVERSSGGEQRSYQRSERSSNSYQPSRSSAPSRSYSAPAPSRSSGFGGGSRSSGGGSGGGSRGGRR